MRSEGGFGGRARAFRASRALRSCWFGVVFRWLNIAENGDPTGLAAIRHLGGWLAVTGRWS